MNKSGLFVLLASLGFSSAAAANSFNFDFSEPGADPTADFDEVCLGDEPAEDCDARAAVIEGELFTLLVMLENDDDPATVELFTEVIEHGSPALQSIAVAYFARTQTAPSGFLSAVKTFFFGGEAQLGSTAAGVLALESDSEDQELGNLFREQRSPSDYEPRYAGGDADALASACLKDARLNLMGSFTSKQQFAPAERLLMYDRFVVDFMDTTVDYPVTAFATDSDLDDVTDYFTKLFGKEPKPPTGESQAKLLAITEEMVALQVDALDGDMAAIKRIQELGDQMAELQEAVTLGNRLQLGGIHAENSVFWVEGDEQDATQPLPRAVAIEHDALLDRVVIRYLNGAVSEDAFPGEDDPDQADPDEDPNSDPEDEGADGGSSIGEDPDDSEEDPDDDDSPKPNTESSSNDSGCSVARPNQAGLGSAALLIATVLVFGSRRRRV